MFFKLSFLSLLLTVATLVTADVLCSPHNTIATGDMPNVCAFGVIFPTDNDPLGILFDNACRNLTLGTGTPLPANNRGLQGNLPYMAVVSETNAQLTDFRFGYAAYAYRLTTDPSSSSPGAVTSHQDSSSGSCSSCPSNYNAPEGATCCGYSFQCHDLANKETLPGGN
ncbi:hypothetical protein B7494_g7634 [Chlorociboria aeruginascens]|nr:hypothetical protein B7494_g7634 [Chlorociboria aeruginascens]